MLRLVLGMACVLAGCAGCQKGASSSKPNDVSPPSAASSASNEPKWLASASRAPSSLAQSARERRLSKNGAPPNAAQVDVVLDEVAAQEASAAGIRRAATILKDAPTKLSDPNWAGSGTAPFAMWLHAGGIALLADLAQRACTSEPQDKEVMRAIDTIDLPPIFNSGGVDRGSMDRLRSELRAAASACGTL